MKFVITFVMFLLSFSNIAYSCDDEYVTLMNNVIIETRTSMDNIVVNELPTALVIAQAILETGYGKSNAATIKNNHFGMMSAQGLMQYDSINENVSEYFLNLNNHNAYSNLRDTLEQGEKDLETIMRSYASTYAQDPKYVFKIISIVNSCKLYQLD